MLVTCSAYLGIASSQRLTEFLTTNTHSRKPPGPGSGCLRSLDFREKKNVLPYSVCGLCSQLLDGTGMVRSEELESLGVPKPGPRGPRGKFSLPHTLAYDVALRP